MLNYLAITITLVVSLAALSVNVDAFYLPGLAPKAYCKVSKASETCKVSLIIQQIYLCKKRC